MSTYGNGYDGNKMSNNARAAYAEGSAPISKWSKAAILDSLESIAYKLGLPLPLAIKKLTLPELRQKFLERVSSHHTGKYFNLTPFYQFDESAATALLIWENVSQIRRFQTTINVVENGAWVQKPAILEGKTHAGRFVSHDGSVVDMDRELFSTAIEI